MANASKRGLGVLYILGAALGFALMNLFVNLAGDLPTMQKVFFRNLVAGLIVFVLLFFEKDKFKIRNKECLLWLFLRAAFGFVGIVLNFYAIDHIGSISDASILNKLSPFFAILFSCFLLKEKPKWQELIFVLVAFGGAMFVVRPSFNVKVLPALSGFLSGACAGFAYTCVRILGEKGERSLMTIFFFSAFSTLVSLPFFIAFYHPMSGLQFLYLLLSGVSAAVGQFFITAAYRCAPAKEIAVFDYAQVPFAAVLGYFFLSQIPDTFSYIGYAVIFAAAFGKWLYALRAKPGRRTADGKSAANHDRSPEDSAAESDKIADESPPDSEKNGDG